MKTKVGSVVWRFSDGSEAAATLYSDGSWRVEAPAPRPLEQTLTAYYSDPEWHDSPADGVPGAKKLRDLAERFGGELRFEPRPDEPEGEVIH